MRDLYGNPVSEDREYPLDPRQNVNVNFDPQSLKDALKSVLSQFAVVTEGKNYPQEGVEESSLSPIDFISPGMVTAPAKALAKGSTILAREAIEAAPRIVGNEIGAVGKDISNLIKDRLVRAKKAKFSPKTWYHGTRGDISEFKTNPEGANLYGEGVYLTDNPEEANAYAIARRLAEDSEEKIAGPNILPLRVRAEKPLDLSKAYVSDDPEINALKQILKDIDKWDVGSPKSRHELYNRLVRRFGKENVVSAIKQLGYDSMIIPRQINTSAKPFKNLVVFDPAKVRSVNADFDLSKLGSRDIMAGLAGAGLIGEAGLSSNEAEASQTSKFKKIRSTLKAIENK